MPLVTDVVNTRSFPSAHQYSLIRRPFLTETTKAVTFYTRTYMVITTT